MNNKTLTKEEQYYCELYVHGDAPYTGNASICYKEAFGEPDCKTTHMKAMRIMHDPRIKAKIEELEVLSAEDHTSMKKFLTTNLKHIVEECTTAVYRDRRGTCLSPAPLRSVAVGASKALMDLYPVKEAQKHELSIDGAGEGGITFNVIVPERAKETKPTDDE